MSNPMTLDPVKMYDWNDRKVDMSNYQEPTLTEVRAAEAPQDDEVQLIENPLTDTPAVEQPPVQAAPVVEDPDYVNPQARVRILERDNEIMANRLNMTVQMLQNMANSQPAPVQDPNPYAGEEQSPVDVIVNKLKTIEDKIQYLDQRQQVAKQQESVEEVLGRANAKIQERLASDEDYQQAFAHLADVVKGNIDDDFPNKTEQEKMLIAFQSINQKKLEWIAQGKEPEKEMYKYAKRMGHRPAAPATAAPQAQANAREQIQKEKARDTGTGTVATVPASNASRPNRVFAKMSDEEFHRELSKSVKDGQFNTVGLGRRTPSMHELLPGKAIQQ